MAVVDAVSPQESYSNGFFLLALIAPFIMITCALIGCILVYCYFQKKQNRIIKLSISRPEWKPYSPSEQLEQSVPDEFRNNASPISNATSAQTTPITNNTTSIEAEIPDVQMNSTS